ncbi:complement factor H-related protein 1-like [Leuresthes tenuis]|uniref:complement factor H-related protein 1-like n=1 Tax=Leuresthes tenuis TaxID=355514 RepID=UPI003B51389B
MWLRCLRFALLVWIPGMLHAQIAERCRAPSQIAGYFLPLEEFYAHEATIHYACNNKHKPVGEGWWATSTCQNGKWVPKPQCIDEFDCLPLNIPNAENTKSLNGWYEVGHILDIKCDGGYISKNNVTEIECTAGTWSEVPDCEKSKTACSVPTNYPNAVITGHKYQEVFAENSKVQYQCRDGYATEDQTTTKYIICKNGQWTEGPKCKLSSSSYGSKDDSSVPSFTTIDKCGEFPVVADGVVHQDNLRFLRYECVNFYKLVGSAEVACYSDGTWSAVPSCRANYCSVNTADYVDLVNHGLAFVTNGETKRLYCKDKWRYENFALVECNDGTAKISQCCNIYQINLGLCWSLGLMTH